MKIVITGGKHEADFIVKMLKEEHHQLIVINQDREFAEYISSNNDIPVFPGDPTKAYCLSDAEADNADVLLALSDNDTDNYITCITAKRLFNIKKTVSKVRNPKNVELFKKLGIDSVISSTYLLAQTILNESSVENIIKTLSIEDEKIVMLELGVEEDFALVNKRVMDIQFPRNINIGCIFRDPHVIIPKGDTVVRSGDKLIIISTPSEQDEIIEFIQKRR
ncbi:potassium channel family protein [Peloplasma aerotolerans]|jgi:trk system potassium uptake protein|uniref:NAD-binding protein n=1 Tax=Peloplasma aerotolerans TaxID=3044389 RepID=A0AAW6U8A9_9MOLU|nr:NAD-binding protein [Mariniplasma sp. M4Ah]MDI6453005.1 NAD-binding protein [Mariniplasma sp. M4Ah]